MIPMSVKRPKAEVARRRCHFRYVPFPEVAMLVEEPSTAGFLIFIDALSPHCVTRAQELFVTTPNANYFALDCLALSNAHGSGNYLAV